MVLGITNIEGLLELALFIGIIIAALYTAEARPISRAIGGFMVLSTFIGFLYLFLYAPYVAAFQIAVYVGAVTVLMLLAISVTKGESLEEEKEGEKE